jgi:hypothetical protein
MNGSSNPELTRAPSLRGTVSPEEWQVRVELAACYRLVALFGWDDLVFTHISARVPGAADQFLVNPYGLRTIDALPRRPIGKVLKRELRDQHGAV